eukprot:gene23637-9841_t
MRDATNPRSQQGRDCWSKGIDNIPSEEEVECLREVAKLFDGVSERVKMSIKMSMGASIITSYFRNRQCHDKTTKSTETLSRHIAKTVTKGGKKYYRAAIDFRNPLPSGNMELFFYARDVLLAGEVVYYPPTDPGGERLHIASGDR